MAPDEQDMDAVIAAADAEHARRTARALAADDENWRYAEMDEADAEVERRLQRARESDDDLWQYLEEVAPGRRVSDEVHREALLSEDGVYRYRLSRRWADGPRCLFIMLNPSTADALVDDATIRRCIAYAKAWGHGTLDVVNLFALRSTDPEALYAHADAIGPDNDRNIIVAARAASTIIVAWGAHGSYLGRDAHVLDLLRQNATVPIMALGFTKGRQPKHPLYLRADLKPVPV